MSSSNSVPSNSSLKGKRKKKMSANPNPLFSQWLQEWKDEAVERGWKSAHTYGQALKTLKLFPLTLESGKDCKLLRNFGDKICKMLDEKLAQYKLDGGVLPAANESMAQTTVSSSNLPKTRHLDVAASHSLPGPSKRKDATSVVGPSSKRNNAHNVSDDSDSDSERRSPPQKKRVPSGNAREYVPAYRSGPYALILSLYRTMQAPGYRGFVSKADLIETAQPLSDKSFSIPDPGSHYTAWSSMGNLLRKGLIIKYSNPAKFFLTEKGQALGERLEEAENGNGALPAGSPPVNSQASVNSRTGNVLGSGFSNNSASTTSSAVTPGSQIFDTGDADLDAALNASLTVNTQSDRDRSYNEGDECEDAEIYAALNKSLELNNCRSERQTVALEDDTEDADLKAALKASLETSSAHNEREACNHLSPQRQYVKRNFNIEVQDSDLEAAIKASLESSSCQPFSPSKTHQSPSDIKEDSSFSPEAKYGVRPLPSLSSPAEDSDDAAEDEDMKRAIAESLLSYSQELSTSQCSLSDPTGDTDKVTKSDPSDQIKPNNLNMSSDHSILVLSDDDDDTNFDAVFKKKTSSVSPLKTLKRPHEVSPSPSPPPQPLPDLSSSPTTSVTISSSSHKTSTSELHGQSKFTSVKFLSNKQPVSSSRLKFDNKCEEDVITIADVDDVENNNQFKPNGLKPVSVSAVDSDDELPDLDVPLFQRLLNKGNIHSDLLEDSATRKKNLTKPEKPAKDIDSSSDIAIRCMKQSEAVLIDKDSKVPEQKMSAKSVGKGATSSLPSSAFLRESTSSCVEKEKVFNINTTHTKVPQSVSNGLKTNPTEAACSILPSSTSEKYVLTSAPIFTLQPGTFDIILCLDNREFYGSKSSCKTLLPDLLKSGVQCDLRLLHVGDLLWIARERVGPQIDRVQGRELVLNYIIERKRMDDLVSSLTDGRMKEQKFRLKHCGLSETIILIEEYGSVQNFSLSEDRIKQSIVNSQIIDGFKVKRCASPKDAVSYLAIMTRFLQQCLCSKTLHGVPVDQMKLIKNQQNIHHSVHYLAPFNAFNEAAIKHKDLNVTELFAKQLIQVPGISSDKAKAIINVYPTLCSLMEAYKHCSGTKDSEKLLATIKFGKNERNLGIAVSRMLHMLYTQQESLP